MVAEIFSHIRLYFPACVGWFRVRVHLPNVESFCSHPLDPEKALHVGSHVESDVMREDE